MSVVRPTCLDTDGACFARTKYGNCSVLNECSEHCRFKKPTASRTKGKEYPINPLYIGTTGTGGIEMSGKAWKKWREEHGYVI